MALIGFKMYYSFPNIGADRNTFKWSLDAGVTWQKYSLPIGAYGLPSLEEAFQNEIVKKGGDQTGITLQPNKVTLKTILKLEPNY